MRAAGRGTLLFTGSGIGAEAVGAGRGARDAEGGAARTTSSPWPTRSGPLGIHAATVTIRGVVGSAPAFEPTALAEHFWTLHTPARDAWQTEPPRHGVDSTIRDLRNSPGLNLRACTRGGAWTSRGGPAGGQPSDLVVGQGAAGPGGRVAGDHHGAAPSADTVPSGEADHLSGADAGGRPSR